MIKNKKQMFIIIGAFLLVLTLFTTTYAFFNYTRTGASNTVRVGRISFVTRQTETINLSNVFPIDKANLDTDTDNVDSVVIEIEGDTDYTGGIEYLVSSKDTHLTVARGNKTIDVPVSLDITTTGLGDNTVNYFTDRESKDTTMYKKIVGDTLVGDGMLLVGYIKPNTTSGTIEGINGSITIKAYFDKDKVKISDTFDGTESDNMGTTNEWTENKTILTTSEWNALQQNGISFKVKVEANEGIWVVGSIEEIMRTRAVMDNIQSTFVSSSTGIDFGEISSDTNGKGIYTRAGTENDNYPIVYYRGAVEDNNVYFANKCWKAVRTTDTGGVKLLYNGESKPLYEKVPLAENQYTIPNNATNDFTFNSFNNSWEITITDNAAKEISFMVPSGDNYTLIQTGTSGLETGGSWSFYKDGSYIKSYGNGGGQPMNDKYEFGTLTSSNVIKWTYTGSSSEESPITFQLQMIQPGDMILEKGCDNAGRDTQIEVSSYNLKYKAPMYVGYMYGEEYTIYSGSTASGTYFGNSFVWDGEKYTLTDAISTKNNTHHYTCNLKTADGTCETIRYYYSSTYYINLTGGDGIEKAIEKMQTNTTNSIAKTKIDDWYANNMTEVTDRLEDTIWCNDRSFGDGNNNGWIANGGNLNTTLFFGAKERSNEAANTSTVKNQPSLFCANKNDRFTVNNTSGNGDLIYPVATLTEDEMVLAGAVESATSNLLIYIFDEPWWSLSPVAFNSSAASVFSLDFAGRLYGDGKYSDGSVNSGGNGLRPSISLKQGQLIIKGTGLEIDPYVIE